MGSSQSPHTHTHITIRPRHIIRGVKVKVWGKLTLIHTLLLTHNIRSIHSLSSAKTEFVSSFMNPLSSRQTASSIVQWNCSVSKSTRYWVKLSFFVARTRASSDIFAQLSPQPWDQQALAQVSQDSVLGSSQGLSWCARPMRGQYPGHVTILDQWEALRARWKWRPC